MKPCKMSDNGGHAGLTPSPSEINGCNSPAELSLQAHAAQDSSANSVRRPSSGRGESYYFYPVSCMYPRLVI